MSDAKARLREKLKDVGHSRHVYVHADDLRSALRELGELRQIVQQQAKGLRDAGNAALAEHRSMGRVFANAAAASALRENAILLAALNELDAMYRRIAPDDPEGVHPDLHPAWKACKAALREVGHGR